MLHAAHKQNQRVRDLVSEYDEFEDVFGKSSPALHDFVQKLKVILKEKIEITSKDGTNHSNSESNRNDSVSQISLSTSQIGVSLSNTNAKVTEALGNHVVLTEIFKCGNFCDLKNFRLINKQWKGIANSTIIQRRLWKLTMKEKFIVNGKKGSLEMNDCIEASGGSFPLTILDFSYLIDLDFVNSPAPQQFYDLMGPSIKEVKFHIFGPLTMVEFQDLLVNKMPNVEQIDAGKILWTNQEECSLPRIVLPFLKTIRFNHSEEDDFQAFEVHPYYPFILHAATNLKEIFDFPVQLTDDAIETGKIDCVQSFNFALEMRSYWKETWLALCVKFAHSEPKLTSLSLSRGPIDPYDDDDDDELMISLEIAASLKRILISSKDTLKHLHCEPGLFPVDFEFPKFTNLESLTVDDNDKWIGKLPRVFPAACDFGEIFPNVLTVSLSVILEGSENLYKYFPDQIFPSVKTLEFQNSFQLGRSLKSNFPNVSHIRILNFESMISRTKNEFSFEVIHPYHPKLDNQIESLEFHHCVLAGLGQEFEVDSLFTGVPPEIRRKLLETDNNCKARDNDEGEGNDVSFVKAILKLVQSQHYAFRNSEGLRRLKIIFNHKENVNFRISTNADSDFDSEDGSSSDDDDDDEKVDSPPAPVISTVSCVYGFSLMPNLEQVIIGYDHYLPNSSDIAQIFKPIAEFPYVKIVHEPTKY